MWNNIRPFICPFGPHGCGDDTYHVWYRGSLYTYRKRALRGGVRGPVMRYGTK